MKIRQKITNIYPTIERLVFALLVVLCFANLIWGFIPERWYRRIFLVMLLYYVGQQLLLETCFHRLDGAFHHKYRASYYDSNPSWKPAPISRRGLWKVILCYLIFAGISLVMKRKGLITWPLYLLGANAILMLNNIFIYYKCPFQVLFLKDVTCCANCHISAWDYVIFATGLLLVPDQSPVLLGGCWLLWVISLIVLFVWEVNLRRYPQRFTPKGNRSLACKNCMKRCTATRSFLRWGRK